MNPHSTVEGTHTVRNAGTAQALTIRHPTAPNPENVLDEIRAELDRQHTKWGEQNHPDGTGAGHFKLQAASYQAACDRALKAGNVTWSDIIREELYEALAEGEPGKLRTELVQVAAVAAQWIAAIDRRQEGQAPSPRPHRGTHSIRWVHCGEDIHVKASCAAVKNGAESACTVSAECDCEAFNLERDEYGYFHTAIEHDDEDVPTEIRHVMSHDPDTAECNYLLFINGQWEELYAGMGAEVHSGEIEFSWSGDYYTWDYVTPAGKEKNDA